MGRKSALASIAEAAVYRRSFLLVWATVLVVSPLRAQIPSFEWVRDAGGPEYDQGIGIAPSGSGSIYLTGGFRGSGLFGSTVLTNNYNGSPLDGMFVARYDSAGTVVWAKGIQNNNVSYGFAVAPDNAGNIYVSGQFIGAASFGSTNLISGTGYDAFLAKYTSSGNVVWVRQGRGDGYQGGRSVAVGTNGSVHWVGIFEYHITFGSTGLTNNNPAVFHTKYDSAGNLLWARQSSPIFIDDGLGIGGVAVDFAGNSYVGGSYIANIDAATQGVGNFSGILVTNTDPTVDRSIFRCKRHKQSIVL